MWFECSECGGHVQGPSAPAVCPECGVAGVIFAETEAYSLVPAAHCIELSAKQIDRLNNLTPATGERHNEANMAVIDR